MKLSDFSYVVPRKLIAKQPANPRDHAKLMVINRKTGIIEDKRFDNIIDYMKKGDCLVVNDTKVFPALLVGKKEKTSAKIQCCCSVNSAPRKACRDTSSSRHAKSG